MNLVYIVIFLVGFNLYGIAHGFILSSNEKIISIRTKYGRIMRSIGLGLMAAMFFVALKLFT